ncbi:MAG: PaaI family thioesterase [Deltaproteobacteria bacterium]|nr:PaaI family thioesterase [Deltaproteobacteria bacterium]
MKRLNPAYLEAVAGNISKSPFFTLISMELRELDQGRCRLEVVIQEKHLQPFGMVHGGVYSSLVDSAAFWAVYSRIDEDMGMTTVEMKLNYLAPASEGSLIAKGKSIKVGKTICLGEASIEDEKGRLVAHGTATMMVLRDVKILGRFELPPKFLY